MIVMFWGWFGKKRVEELEANTKKGFESVKKDIDAVGKWIKHLDQKDKQVFDLINSLRGDLSTIRDELAGVREGVDLAFVERQDKQVFKKLPVLDKQTGVYGVEKAVQTAVQTGSFYNNLNGLSSNERLLLFTHINSIKQKSEGLIEEMVEKNGKKRVFVPNFMKEKLAKYAKVRSGKKEE